MWIFLIFSGNPRMKKKNLEDLAHDPQQPLIYTTFFIYFDSSQRTEVCGHIAVAKSDFEYLSCWKSTARTVENSFLCPRGQEKPFFLVRLGHMAGKCFFI